MSNRPVAWTDGKGNYFDKNSFFPVDDLIPLYTHPVKELTDEEIANTWDDVRKDATLKPSMKDMQDFARAIMKRCGIISGTDK